MWYLMNMFALPLLTALALGGVVGWMTWSRAPTRWLTGWVPWGFAAFGLGLILALLKAPGGRLGLWLDLGLIFFAVYIIGCCLGGAIRGLFATQEPHALAVAGAGASVAGGAAAPMAFAAVPAQAAPVAAAPVAVQSPVPEDSRLESAEAEPEQDPQALVGARPAGLAAPRGGVADDLKRIRGIGRQNEGRLHGLGVWHFDQIAAWTAEEAAWVGGYLAFPGRIEREDWIGQAKILASGAETEFSQRVAAGEVPTSADAGDKGQDNVEPPPARG